MKRKEGRVTEKKGSFRVVDPTLAPPPPPGRTPPPGRRLQSHLQPPGAATRSRPLSARAAGPLSRLRRPLADPQPLSGSGWVLRARALLGLFVRSLAPFGARRTPASRRGVSWAPLPPSARLARTGSGAARPGPGAGGGHRGPVGHGQETQEAQVGQTPLRG